MRRRRPAPRTDPFAILGLDPSPDLSDEDVRIAWRWAASETHPDREDGGDPARFAAAAAAYTTLRTRFTRGEALADLRAGRPQQARSGGPRPRGALASLAARVQRGRPLRLGLRILVAAAAGVAAVLAAGPHPAAPALVTGVATWLILTARHDLAPPIDSTDATDRGDPG
jgi:curved DNA-binding protein CbpA